MSPPISSTQNNWKQATHAIRSMKRIRNVKLKRYKAIIQNKLPVIFTNTFVPKYKLDITNYKLKGPICYLKNLKDVIFITKIKLE
jgi:hypothetical protein